MVIIAFLVLFLIIFKNPQHSNPDEQPQEYTLQEVQGIDEKNLSNISRWQEVPIVSEEILSKDYLGGKDEQCPLCIAGNNDDSQIIFYGTFKSTNGGQTFYTINVTKTNSITQGVQGGSEPLCIRVNKATGELWCAGNCLGFSKLSAPYETASSKNQIKHKVTIIDLVNNQNKYLYIYDKRKIVISNLFDDNYNLYLDKLCTNLFSGIIEND